VIHKVVSSWNRSAGGSGSSELIAVTGLCTSDGTQSINSAFTYAWIEINEVDFFQPTSAQPVDLQSILTHELGHLLGLGHSCTESGDAGFPSCTSEYGSAVMFPSVPYPDGSHIRKALTLNDQYRANCLY
jgi:hypothetical protein